MRKRRQSVVVKSLLISIIITIYLIPNSAFGQRQYKIRQMRNEMSSSLETYSFGYSWDNRSAFDSLYKTFVRYQDLLSKNLIWKNRPGNSTEREFLRLLTNFGISTVDDQQEKYELLKVLLEYDPYLITNDTDNLPELTNQVQRLYPLPSFKVGVKLGINLNNTLPGKKSYEVVQNPSSTKNYASDIGWQIAFPISYLFGKNHTVAIEPGMSYSNLNITQNVLGNSQTFKYRTYFSELPIIYKLTLLNPRLKGFKNIDTYNQATIKKLDAKVLKIDEKIEGSSFAKSAKLERRKSEKISRKNHLLMNSPYYRFLPSIILGIKPKLGVASFIDSNNANELTNAFQFDAIGGFGLEWFRPRTTFGLELRYYYGLTNVNTTERYFLGGEVSGLLFNDFYVSDDFRMQTFEISFVINYILSNKAFRFR
jgi:hypothetical protein